MEKSNNSIKITSNKVAISVSVYIFKENNTYIAYCPSLDLSGYDLTDKGAKDSFNFILKEWLHEQLANHTLRTDLERHGWEMKSRTAHEPKFQKLRASGLLDKILAQPEYIRTNAVSEVALS